MRRACAKRLLLTVAVLAAGLLGRPAARAQLFERTDRQKEIELGRAAARDVQDHTPASKDPAMVARVRRIGSALVGAMTEKVYTYEFKVLASPEFNAFCLPGGFMFVNEGLLTRLPDDNSVAWVMGHEITHAAHRHWAHMIHKTSRDAVFGILFDVATGTNIGMLEVQLLNLKYSRGDEADADRTGLDLMWRAGYDPSGALSAIQIMEDMEKGRHVPNYLRDHPAPKDRRKQAQSQIAVLATQSRPALTNQSVKTDISRELRSVAGTPPTQETTRSEWFPLAVGNEWTYQVTGNGARTQYTNRIIGSVPLEKGSVYRAVTALRGVEVAYQLMSTGDGLLRRNRPTAADSPWKIEYALSLPATGAVSRDEADYSLLPSEPVSVPAGKFTDVLKLRKKTALHTIDLYFGKGVGLLKSVCEDTGVTELLSSYRVNAVTAP